MSCFDNPGAMTAGSTEFSELFVTGSLWGWPANAGWNQLCRRRRRRRVLCDTQLACWSCRIQVCCQRLCRPGTALRRRAGWGDLCSDPVYYDGEGNPVQFANRQVEAGSSTNDTYGSCTNCSGQIIDGCMNANACNYDEFANNDDGSCSVPDLNCPWRASTGLQQTLTLMVTVTATVKKLWVAKTKECLQLRRHCHRCRCL